MSKVYITRLKWNKQQYKTVKLSIMQYSKRIKPPPPKEKEKIIQTSLPFCNLMVEPFNISNFGYYVI